MPEAAHRFVRVLERASCRWSTSQTLSIRIAWCVAAAHLSWADDAVPALSAESDDEPPSLSWSYPGERLTMWVDRAGLVTWEHHKILDRPPMWARIDRGDGIPEELIQAVVERRSQALREPRV